MLIALSPRGERLLLTLSGVAAMPTGLLDVIFVPGYWAPAHLISPEFSLEGMIFSFGNGVILWFIASRGWRGRLRSHIIHPKTPLRLAGYGLGSLAVILMLWRGGFGPLPVMDATLLTLVLLGLFVALRRPDLLPLALVGSAGFALAYGLELAGLALIDRGYALVWAPGVRAGVSFLGYPGEELAWAVVYGAVWTLVFAETHGVRIGAKAGKA